MTDAILIAVLGMLAVLIVLVVLVLRRTTQSVGPVLAARLDVFEKVLEQTDRAIKDESGRSREELSKGAREQRQEFSDAFKTFGESLSVGNSESAAMQRGQLDRMRAESALSAKQLREEVVGTLTGLSETNTKTMGELLGVQKRQLDTFSAQLIEFARENGERLDAVRAESATSAKQLREEVVSTLNALAETNTKTMSELSGVQKNQLHAFSTQLTEFARISGERLDGVRAESAIGAKLLREEVVGTLNALSETNTKTLGELAGVQKGQLDAFSAQLALFSKASADKLDAVRTESVNGAKLLREEVVTTLKSVYSDGT